VAQNSAPLANANQKSERDISQGSVASRIVRADIVNRDFIAKFAAESCAKEFRKSACIWQS